MTICMTNGGLYDNIISVNNEKVSGDIHDLFPLMLNKIKEYEFIIVKYDKGEALIRTSCISSINTE